MIAGEEHGMDRRMAWALVPLTGLALVWGFDAWKAGREAEARARVDETIGVGDVVFGAPPPPGFRRTTSRSVTTVMLGRARWDHPPHPLLDAAVTTYEGNVGRVTVSTGDPQVARRLRADLVARLGAPMKVREKPGGSGDRWIGGTVFVAYDERDGVPGGRVRMTNTRVARLSRIDPAADAEVLPRE